MKTGSVHQHYCIYPYLKLLTHTHRIRKQRRDWHVSVSSRTRPLLPNLKKISCFSDLFGGRSEKPDLKYWPDPCKAQNRRGFWNFRKKFLSELPKNANSKIYSETPKYVLIWKKNQDFHVLRRFSKVLGVFMIWTHINSMNKP